MINSKAIKVLKTFSKQELRQFNDFIKSPYHNKKNNLVKFTNILKKYHPDFAVEDEYVYSQMYGEKPFSNDVYKKLMSELLSLCEGFLICHQLKKQKFTNEFYLLKELGERGIDSLFSLHCRKIQEDIDSNVLYAKHTERINFEELKIYFNLARQVFKDTKPFAVRVNCSLIYFLDQMFSELQSADTLKSEFNLKNFSTLSESFFECFDAEAFSEHLDLNIDEHKLIFVILNFIKMTLNPDDESSFYNAKKYLLSYPIENKECCVDTIGLYDIMHNYCLKKRNDKFNYELFEIYKQKYYLINKFKLDVTMNWAEFKNIVTIALRVKELQWAEDFIKENEHRIHGEFREDIYHYTYAMLEFEKKNYEKALEHSSIVNIDYHYSKAIVRNLSLMCYYELDLIENCLSSIDAYKHFLKKNDLLEREYKIDFSRFVKLFSQLLKFKMNPAFLSRKEILELKKEGAKLKSGKEWILTKLTEQELSLKEKSKRNSNVQIN